MISIPVSFGELLDKITILQIKLDRIEDPKKRNNIATEYAILKDIIPDDLNRPDVNDLCNQLKDVNAKLWDIEDSIRECERSANWGDDFIDLARSVYITNDRRSEIKKQINLITSSPLIEEKSYAPY